MSTIDRAAMRKRAESYLHGCERTGNADSRLAQIARDVLLLLDVPPVSAAGPSGGRWWSRRFAPTGAGYPRWRCARCEADTDADAAPLRCAHCGYGASKPVHVDGAPATREPRRWWFSERCSIFGGAPPVWRCAKCGADTTATAEPVRCGHCGYEGD